MNLNAKTLGIISIKGGVGKTTSVVALGHALAKDFGKKVLLVDGNLTAANLGLHVGVYNPAVTLHDVLEGRAKACDAVCRTQYGFDIIAGSSELRSIKISPFKLAEKLRDIKRKYDIVLIDSSPNIGDELAGAMLASDELIAVTTPDYVTLAATLRAVKTAKDKKTPIIGLIVNKVYNKEFELNLNQIEELSGTEVLASIPHEMKVMLALSYSSPATLSDSESSVEYKKLAGALVGQTFKDKNKGKAFIHKLFGMVPKQDINRDLLKNERIKNGFF